MINDILSCRLTFSGNYAVRLEIGASSFARCGFISIHDNTLGQNVLNTSFDVDDLIKCYFWLHSHKYDSFNAYGSVRNFLIEFGEFVENNCVSVSFLDSFIEYLDNNTYHGFSYEEYLQKREEEMREL